MNNLSLAEVFPLASEQVEKFGTELKELADKVASLEQRAGDLEQQLKAEQDLNKEQERRIAEKDTSLAEMDERLKKVITLTETELGPFGTDEKPKLAQIEETLADI